METTFSLSIHLLINAKKKKVNSFGGAVRQTLNGEGPQGDMEMLHNETDRLEAKVRGKGFGVKKTAGLVMGNYRK